MTSKILTALIDHPLLTSIFLTDFFILLVHTPPFFWALSMFVILIGLSLFFGQKMALFKV